MMSGMNGAPSTAPVQVPRAEAILLLTFSTPLVQIADAMVDLFDAVAGSLSWMDAA